MSQNSDACNALIETIAPALRILCGQEKAPAVITLLDKTPAKSPEFSPKPDSDSGTIITMLKDLISRNSNLPGLAVPGAGYLQITRQSPRKGRMAGKTAVVTGAAQGFGLEIAQSLAEEGATVVLGDLNVAGAIAAADALNKKYGSTVALGLPLNVTDSSSVKALIFETVKKFGGFDLFVSNAGVLKAGSVLEQSEKDFDFVTSVNYKGFFLCVKHAVPVLAAQHKADPAYLGDIIQINSKSGLEGSNRNAAYAGSKFGGIGLVQSYALELFSSGIKVNAICPGNFFDGPLWSDPKNGLFVQYLKTGKVAGAKTVAEVKKAYEAKVPMGRGCTTPDVMTAVYYLVDQKYETGQAVPVTGGQVMLK
jgi:sorbitol-6-phosphate 2-dehydrogenase